MNLKLDVSFILLIVVSFAFIFYVFDSDKTFTSYESFYENITTYYGNYTGDELLKLSYVCKDYAFPDCPENVVLKKNKVACTGSMRPTLSCFDDVYSEKNPTSVGLCDVITFERSTDSKHILHRIVGLNGTNFITKGDANLHIDPYQPSFKEIKSKVCRK